MPVQLGYLLPTRERIMKGEHSTGAILDLADRAERVGLDSVWIGDSLLAKPRHDALALIAAIAGRTRRIRMGTAVLLPMLRNPVLLAHTVATVDRIAEGRLILGVGTARDVPAIRAEFAAAGVPFEKRIALMLEQLRLCRALWGGDKVDWDGRWTVRQAELAPTPHTPGGPPIWGGGAMPGALKRAGRYFQGWFPSGPGGPVDWAKCWQAVKGYAKEAGRDPAAITGAAYVTVAVEDDQAGAEASLNGYLERYYLLSATTIRSQQFCFAGNRKAATEWLHGFIDGGATHLCVRFTGGDAERQMDTLAEMRAEMG
jgi:alkanesulfonate monooxygenase SsuD/methylene tetrahydromethanopterin reductase-like flavin-dependent oxidoreductase (luciferase family)